MRSARLSLRIRSIVDLSPAHLRCGADATTTTGAGRLRATRPPRGKGAETVGVLFWFAGFVAGALFGVVVTALMVAASRGDE